MTYLKKIDKFIATRILTKKLEPIIYLVWVVLALFIRRDMYNVWPATSFAAIILLGLMFLRVGISSVRDKNISGGKVVASKKESVKWGYILILLSIILLFYPS